MIKLSQITWIILNDCNLDCSYCCPKTHEPEEQIPFDKIKKVFSDLYTSTFFISGGEPFLIKELPEIINLIDAKYIGIFTNATLITEDILSRINNSKTNFLITYHGVPFDPFVKTVKMIEQKFGVMVNGILRPGLTLEEVKALTDKFSDAGIKLDWKPCQATYEGAEYPNPEYIKKFKGYWADSVKPLEESNCRREWKGKLCRAGRDLLYIFKDQVFKCTSGRFYGKPIGNLYEGNLGVSGEALCEYDRCRCYYQGQRFAEI